MPPLRTQEGDIIASTGITRDDVGYSGFENTGLASQLMELGIRRVGIVGIATEYCVRATALDAQKAGFETTMLADLIRSINQSDAPKVFGELRRAGAKFATAAEWLASL